MSLHVRYPFITWPCKLLSCVFSQIDTSRCGTTACCFQHPSGCSGTGCSILIAFQYNQSASVLDVEIGTKETWVAFGINNTPKEMVIIHIFHWYIYHFIFILLWFLHTFMIDSSYANRKKVHIITIICGRYRRYLYIIADYYYHY